MLFVQQPLALPGSAKYSIKESSQPNVLGHEAESIKGRLDKFT